MFLYSILPAAPYLGRRDAELLAVFGDGAAGDDYVLLLKRVGDSLIGQRRVWVF
jgi:hypothetical protein